MYLKSLSLYNFKNHSESIFKFEKSINCFIGENGAGKTNILDAVHYLCLTKSYFNHIDSHNIQFDKDYFMITGDVLSNEKKYKLQCNVERGKGKAIKIDKSFYKRFSDHIGRFPLIIISPTDSNLIIETSDIRRRYIDSNISQYNKTYLKNLISYNKILKQRNALLKQFSEKGKFDLESIETYDDQLIKYGEEIYKERLGFLKKITPVFQEYYKGISDNKESVSLIYKTQLNDSKIKDLLKKNLSTDMRLQRTTVGIHKDDIDFQMDGRSVKRTASQGQQKSFLMSLKLAYFDLLSEELEIKPFLLLDDIFDKLDENRVQKLMDFVNKGKFGQVFITDTDKVRSERILNLSTTPSQIFEISEGKLL